ncbi:hypothetical protein [Geitlerinema sp. PCC 9228]|jgi:hypothetical protein|nr:hypothetical protein [Geitlerinema sp. PCC 9228]
MAKLPAAWLVPRDPNPAPGCPISIGLVLLFPAKKQQKWVMELVPVGPHA